MRTREVFTRKRTGEWGGVVLNKKSSCPRKGELDPVSPNVRAGESMGKMQMRGSEMRTTLVVPKSASLSESAREL